jgi:hypothetical protein
LEAPTLAVLIFGATVVAVFGYGLRRNARSRRRLAAGQCVRCGVETRDPIDLTPVEPYSSVALQMCATCATRTRRNHRIAYRAAVGVYGLALVATALVVTLDLRRGAQYSLRDYWWLAGVMLFPAVAVLPTFRRGLGRDDDRAP